MQGIAGTIFVQVVTYILTAAIAAVAAGLTHWLVQLAGKTKLQQVEAEIKAEVSKVEAAATAMGITNDVVNKAVLYVQQEFETLGGPAKYQKAIDWTVAQLNARGVLVTNDEISGLISAALKTLKKDFNDDWTKDVDTPATPAVADPPPQALADTVTAQAVPDAAVQVASDTVPAQDASTAEVAPAIPIPDPVAIAQAAAQEAQVHAQAAADAAARAAQAVAQVMPAS